MSDRSNDGHSFSSILSLALGDELSSLITIAAAAGAGVICLVGKLSSLLVADLSGSLGFVVFVTTFFWGKERDSRAVHG